MERLMIMEIPICLEQAEIQLIREGRLTSFIDRSALLAPGDVLWLKEDIAVSEHALYYEADGLARIPAEHIRIARPFMPKRYARIWLEVASVRQERHGAVMVFPNILSTSGRPAF